MLEMAFGATLESLKRCTTHELIRDVIQSVYCRMLYNDLYVVHRETHIDIMIYSCFGYYF